MTEMDILHGFGKDLVFQIVNLLVKNKKVDTGKLKNSIRYKIENVNGVMRLAIVDLSGYFSFVDNGVNGYNVNVGSPFSFKTGPGSKKLKGWVQRKLKVSPDKVDEVSFLVSRSIASKGIKPANASYRIIDEAYKITWNKWKGKLMMDYKELLKEKIIKELQNNFKVK